MLSPPPDCPRCGYDQTGAVAAWTDRCPLRGRCPECGIDFRWRDVLRPELDTPRWFVERRWIGRERVIFSRMVRALRTWWWVLLPWRFWGRIKLHQPVGWLGLLVWLPAVLLVLAIPADVAQVYGSLAARRLGFASGVSLTRMAFDTACQPLVDPDYLLDKP
ncbi:MAG: hypothetical protein IT431_17690 [Phycisphaerales bacterium]|nr:hypothetical protein [Phycisphaerales bacterium]